MTKKILFAFVLCFIFVFSLFNYQKGLIFVNAQSPQQLEELNKKIEEYQNEINRLNAQANTLANQIAQYNAQINLTTLKISQTEDKIALLGGRIDQLEESLTALTEAFTRRANQTYKMSRMSEPYLILAMSDNIPDAVSSYHYLKKIQEADRDLLVRLTDAQTSYKDEKADQEQLQADLEDQKRTLNSQKIAKANLLAETKNDEKKYQELLSQAKAEYEAIQAIIAGRGDETEVGKIPQGARIATIIQGPSCNSTGAHLHFIVSQNGTTQNPFNFLRGGVDFENCSGSSCGSSDGDAFNPSGSWDWPISPKIKFSQGYGSTWAVRNTWVGRIYSFHNGIDINSYTNSDVHAVKAGTLFQGSYTGYNGCRLRYVRVDHDDSDLETFYLHINY